MMIPVLLAGTLLLLYRAAFCCWAKQAPLGKPPEEVLYWEGQARGAAAGMFLCGVLFLAAVLKFRSGSKS